jgi:hypothetical protein
MEGDAEGAAGASALALIRSLVGEQVNSQSFLWLHMQLKSLGYSLISEPGGGYTLRRASTWAGKGNPELHLDGEGIIKEGKSPDRERVSTPGALGDRMETAGVALPKGFQAHHLIPDEVARTHPLAQAARSRGVPPWDIDSANNGIALPGSPDKVGSSGLPVHRGSHANYTEHTKRTLKTAQDALELQYGGLDKVPPEVLALTMNELEKQLRDRIIKDPMLRNTSGRLY